MTDDTPEDSPVLVDLFQTARKVARLQDVAETEDYDSLACDIDQEILTAAYELEGYRSNKAIFGELLLAAASLLMQRIEACGAAGDAQTRAAALASDIHDALGGTKHPPSKEFAIKSLRKAVLAGRSPA